MSKKFYVEQTAPKRVKTSAATSLFENAALRANAEICMERSRGCTFQGIKFQSDFHDKYETNGEQVDYYQSIFS